MNNSVNWDYWLEELYVAAPGAERAFLVSQVRAAAITFCELSEAWRMNTLPIDVVSGKKTYQVLAPLSKTEIVTVIEVFYDGVPISATSREALIDCDPKSIDREGRVTQYYQEYAEQINLHKTPNQELPNGVFCRVAIKPSRIATVIDESIGKRYFDAILSGAKARLYMMPNMPWTDEAAALHHKQIMVGHADRARTEAASGHGRVVRRTKLHLFNGR